VFRFTKSLFIFLCFVSALEVKSQSAQLQKRYNSQIAVLFSNQGNDPVELRINGYPFRFLQLGGYISRVRRGAAMMIVYSEEQDTVFLKKTFGPQMGSFPMFKQMPQYAQILGNINGIELIPTNVKVEVKFQSRGVTPCIPDQPVQEGEKAFIGIIRAMLSPDGKQCALSFFPPHNLDGVLG
jgi:hypothetical protein